MTTFETIDKEQKLRASVQRDVISICTEACHCLGLEITNSAKNLLFYIFLHKMSSYADDLERFAKHAKRSTINSDDCRLLTRRNPTLTAHINSLKHLGGSATKEQAKRRRSVAATSSATPSPAAKRPRDSEAITEFDNDENAIDLTID